MQAGASVIGAAALALALPQTAGAQELVVMFNSAFSPAEVTVVAGDSVTWRNGDLVVHDVRGPGFNSGLIQRFMGFTQRFDTPGTQAYVCGLHPGMAGQVDVLAAQLTTPRGTFFHGEPVLLRGRAAPNTTVTIVDGAGATAGTATANSGGAFKATVRAEASYRARTALGDSPAATLTVRPAPAVKLHAVRGRLKVVTSRNAKGLTARFEQRTSAGWRVFAKAKVGAAGRATTKARPGKLRVTLRRGNAVLATSNAVTV